MHPFMAKRWGDVTEDFGDFILATNIELTYDDDNENLNDEIEYNNVRYRIVSVRHHELLPFDDQWHYVLRRKRMQAGGF